MKAGTSDGRLRYWAVLPSTCTLRLAWDMFVHLASGLTVPPRHHGDDVRVRAVPCAARLLPQCLLTLPLWGGLLYSRDSKKVKWEQASAGGLLIPLSTSELLLRLPGRAELLRARPKSSLGDEAVRRLPQLLTVAVGLASGSLRLILGGLGLLLVAAVLPRLLRRRGSAAAGAGSPEEAAPAAPPQVIGAAAAGGGAAGAAAGTAAAASHLADAGATEAASAAKACWRCFQWCRRATAPLLPYLSALRRALDAVLLTVVVASGSLGLFLTLVAVGGIATSALEAVALAWAPLLRTRAPPCSALDRLLRARAAEVRVALNWASFTLAGLAAVGLLSTLNPESGAAVAVVLLVRFGSEVASNYEQGQEVTTTDNKSARACLGEAGLEILEQELQEHGWVQPDGSFLRHVRRQDRFRGYEHLATVMAGMASIRDMVRAAEKPWRFAVIHRGAAGSADKAGLTRGGYQKLPADTMCEEVIFQERNTGRSLRDAENLEAIAAVLNRHMEAPQEPDDARAPRIDPQQLELLGGFELSEAPPSADNRHKLQVVVRRKIGNAPQQIDKATVNEVNKALNSVLLGALGRRRRKPEMFVVVDAPPVTYPATPPPEEEVRLPIAVDALLPENEEAPEQPPAQEIELNGLFLGQQFAARLEALSVYGWCHCLAPGQQRAGDDRSSPSRSGAGGSDATA